MNKKNLSESDICNKVIRPAIVQPKSPVCPGMQRAINHADLPCV